jgi:hypothetical protein
MGKIPEGPPVTAKAKREAAKSNEPLLRRRRWKRDAGDSIGVRSTLAGPLNRQGCCCYRKVANGSGPQASVESVSIGRIRGALLNRPDH